MNVRYRDMLPGGLLAAVVVFLLSASSPVVLQPLPWDMSHHYLGATGFSNAVAASDADAVRRQLLGADLYPPGHSVILGTWLLAFGHGLRSWILFQAASLAAAVAAMWACGFALERRDRRPFFAAGAVALLSSPVVLVLAGTFLVELPAATLAVLALAGLASVRGDSRRRLAATAALAGAAVGATLLTKYNIGLPLIPAAGALAAWHLLGRRRGAALAVGAAAVAATLIWVSFLSLQDHGWQGFLTFARNRANAVDASPLARLETYVGIFGRHYVVHRLAGAVVSALAVVALVRRRGALTIAAAVYVAASMTAFAVHPYILSRNLFAPAVAVSILAAVGAATVMHDLARLPARRVRPIALLGLAGAVALVAMSAGRARPDLQAYYKGADEDLRRASAFLATEIASSGSCRVVGTFNELGEGWMRVLASRSVGERPRLLLEFPYPLERDRERLDPRPDPAYDEIVAEWRDHPEERVITIELDPGSRYWGDDYERFVSWKRNYVAALEAREDLVPVRSLDLPDAGVHLRVFETSTDLLRFGRGWGPAEHWGRWSMAERAILKIRPAATPQVLHLRYAPFDGLDAPKRCRVLIAGREVDSFEVAGPEWVWRDRRVPLPLEPDAGPVDVEIECSRLDDIHGRLRAVPFALVALEPGP